MATRSQVHNTLVKLPEYRNARKTRSPEAMKSILARFMYGHTDKHAWAMINYKHQTDQFVHIIDDNKVIEKSPSPSFRKGANRGLDLVWFTIVGTAEKYSTSLSSFTSMYEKI
jgi:hypothetical protein